MKPLVIPEDHFKAICAPGHGHKTCRYISAGPNGICCEKHTNTGRLLDSRVKQMVAQGDNCEGLSHE